MADIALSVTVSRVLLGAEPLEINDHTTYRLAPGSMGGAVSWNNQRVSSPFMEGEATIFRTRGMVVEPVVVEVLGTDSQALRTNLNALVGAFIQDTFALSLTVDNVLFSYACEAADYQVSWVGPRFVARQLQVSFQVPRQPVPLNQAVL